jgi:DNA-binding NtrC family response regulator
MPDAARRVLVVDDDPGVRELLVAVLALDDYAVASASDGVEAIARIEAAPPALVVSDVWMPRRSGLSLAAWLHLHYPAMPLVLLSAGVPPDVPAGVPFVAKPFDVNQLLALVRRLIHGEGSVT